MKKQYENPNIIITAIFSQDIITDSLEQYDSEAGIDNYEQDKAAWN